MYGQRAYRGGGRSSVGRHGLGWVWRAGLLWVAACLLGLVSVAQAAGNEPFRLEVVQVAEGVHALIGPTTDRTYDNLGLNANFGVIDTPEGAILVDSGASRAGAVLLEGLARELTGKPVRWVINTGVQDHRWFGNAYFMAQGAEVIAHARTVDSQQRELAAQVARLAPVLGERFEGTEPTSANRVLEDEVNVFVLGGRTLELHYLNDAHFPGDMVLRLPDGEIVFTGDVVYVDRLLGLLPGSDAVRWLDAFERLKALAPAHIVPGHGRVTDLAGAQADTGDYLAFIVSGVSRLADEMAGVEAATAELGDAPAFARLDNYDILHRRNVSQAYLRLEAGL